MPAPTTLSSPLVSPKSSLSLRVSPWSALPTYGVSIPSCSLVTAGSSCIGCTCTPPVSTELATPTPDHVAAAVNSRFTRVSSALTSSSSVALDAHCRSNAPMVTSRSRLSLAQLIRLVSFSPANAATCSRSSTPSAQSLASSTWDNPSASLSSATLLLNSRI
jgi:hypothetical protein